MPNGYRFAHARSLVPALSRRTAMASIQLAKAGSRHKYRVQYRHDGAKCEKLYPDFDAILADAERLRGYDLGAAPVKLCSMSLDEAVAAWGVDLKCRRVTVKHRRQLLAAFDGLRDKCHLKTVEDICPAKCLTFIDEAKSKKALFSAVKSITEYLLRHDLIESDPWLLKTGKHKIRFSKKQKRVKNPARHLSVRDLLSICEAAPKRWAVFYWLKATTGLRNSECARLKHRHIDLKEGLLYLPSEIQKNGDREDVVPLTRSLRDKLIATFGTAPSGYVFPWLSEREDRELSQSDETRCTTAWQKSLKLAGVPYQIPGDKQRATMIAIRATYDDWVIQSNGMKSPVATALMRHAEKGSAKLTFRPGGVGGSGYACQSTILDELRSAVDRLDAWIEIESQAPRVSLTA